MFTGIITSLGEVVAIERRGDLRIAIASDYDPQTIAIGASIACSGVCLTVVEVGPDARRRSRFAVDVRPTLRAPRSAAGNRAPRSTSSARSRSATSWAAIWYSVTPMESPPSRTGRTRRSSFSGSPRRLGLRPIAEKGSIAVDGTSLTVNEVAVPTSRSTSSPILRRSPASGHDRSATS